MVWGRTACRCWCPDRPEYVQWARTLFFVPALAGGVFGLLGGYLTDRLGRRRVLTFSILLYAFSAFAAGFATSLTQLLVFRCLVFIGVCVEFVAAVAWLAELFPNRNQREKVLGYTQAFSSFGGLLVGAANVLAANIALHLPAIHGGHEAWRYTLISGVIPAIPLILIRPFLPESPEWAAQTRRRPAQAPQHPRTVQPRTVPDYRPHHAGLRGELRHRLRRDPATPADPRRATRRHAAGSRPCGHDHHRQGRRRATAVATGSEAGQPELTPGRRRQIAGNASDAAVAKVTLWQEVGGLVGRFVFAMIAVHILSRRALLRVFQLPALILVPLFFWWISTALAKPDTLIWIKLGIFVAGFLTIAQFSFWGNYIPLVFPLHLRGTGESFAANIGGRVIGTAAAWITITLSASTTPSPARIAVVGGCVAGVYVLVGAILTRWLPEPKEGALSE